MSANRWVTPLRLLVEPSRAYDDLLAQPAILPAFLYFAATIAGMWLLNAELYSEIAVAAAIGPAKVVTAWAFLAITLQSIVSVAALTLTLAGMLWLATRLNAPGPGFRRCWVLAVNAALPLAIGWLYGSIMLFFVRPLSVDFLTALSLLLKPFSLGLVTFFPARFEPLTLPWFFASYADLFGLWTVLLLAIGLARFLGLTGQKLLWTLLLLVLLLLLAITGLWQLIQMGIASAV